MANNTLSHVRQIEEKIQPVHYLSYYVSLLPHVGAAMERVLFTNYNKHTVHRNETHISC